RFRAGPSALISPGPSTLTSALLEAGSSAFPRPGPSALLRPGPLALLRPRPSGLRLAAGFTDVGIRLFALTLAPQEVMARVLLAEAGELEGQQGGERRARRQACPAGEVVGMARFGAERGEHR